MDRLEAESILRASTGGASPAVGDQLHFTPIGWQFGVVGGVTLLDSETSPFTPSLENSGGLFVLEAGTPTTFVFELPPNDEVPFHVGTTFILVNNDTGLASHTLQVTRGTGVALRPAISGGSDDTNMQIGSGRGAAAVIKGSEDGWVFLPFGDLTNVSEI